MASNTAFLRVVEHSRRRLRPTTDVTVAEPEWQREGEPNWYERPTIEPPSLLDEHLIALRDAGLERAREREAIATEIAALVGEHEDVDALASNLPALRVPDEHRVFARLVWLVRRWWARLRESQRAKRFAETNRPTKGKRS